MIEARAAQRHPHAATEILARARGRTIDLVQICHITLFETSWMCLCIFYVHMYLYIYEARADYK